MSVTKDQVFEFIDKMTILEMSEFIKILKRGMECRQQRRCNGCRSRSAAAAAPAAEEKRVLMWY
jgi:ribosomal protein L7/L12